MNFYKRYMGDYGRSTGHLSLQDHGAYTLLLDHYYSSKTALPADIDSVRRICGAITESETESVIRVLDKFFPVRPDGLRHNKRCDEEIGKWNAQASVNKEVGKLGGRPKKTESVTESITEQKPSPEARNQKLEVNLKPKNNNKSGSAFAPPDWIPLEAWQGFKAMRKKAGKPMTDRAEVMIVQELEKLRASGEDAVACLAQSEMNGYLGVFPLKAKGHGGNGATAPPEPPCAKCGGSTGIGFIHTSGGRICSRCRAQS